MASSVLVAGKGLPAWCTAWRAAANGASVRFLVAPGDEDYVGKAPGDGPWSPLALPRRVAMPPAELALPLDPLDAAAAIGRRRLAVDALSVLLSRKRRGDTVRDALIGALGGRWAHRWALPWAAARWGPVDEISADVLGEASTGWLRLDAIRDAAREAIWAAEGDLVEDVEVHELDGQVLTTTVGREWLDGPVFADESAAAIVGEPPWPLLRMPVARRATNAPNGVLELARPMHGAWRIVACDSVAYVFGASDADAAEVLRAVDREPGEALPGATIAVPIPSPADQHKRATWLGDLTRRGITAIGAAAGVAPEGPDLTPADPFPG